MIAILLISPKKINRVCRSFTSGGSFQATETIQATATTIWKPGFRDLNQSRFSFEFLVSKETVVLRRWERSKQKFGFIKRVDEG